MVIYDSNQSDDLRQQKHAVALVFIWEQAKPFFICNVISGLIIIFLKPTKPISKMSTQNKISFVETQPSPPKIQKNLHFPQNHDMSSKNKQPNRPTNCHSMRFHPTTASLHLITQSGTHSNQSTIPSVNHMNVSANFSSTKKQIQDTKQTQKYSTGFLKLKNRMDELESRILSMNRNHNVKKGVINEREKGKRQQNRAREAGNDEEKGIRVEKSSEVKILEKSPKNGKVCQGGSLNNLNNKESSDQKQYSANRKLKQYKYIKSKRIQNNITKYYVSHFIQSNQKKNSIPHLHLQEMLKLTISSTKSSKRIPKSPTQLKSPSSQLKPLMKKILVLDLDQTLVHCNEDSRDQYDFKIQFSISNRVEELGIKVRPYAEEFLRKMSDLYQINIFTAASAPYASKIINKLDPNNYISKRYYRKDCTKLQENLVKDLDIFETDLSCIVFVDNSPRCFSHHLDNVIPILPYIDGNSDQELRTLEDFLRILHENRDVRPLIRETFKLHQYPKYKENMQNLISDLYTKNA